MKLLVIGADGWDPKIANYLLFKGELPNLQDLIDNGGSVGPMASRLGEQDVPHTGPAWITIYTGSTEREHGVTYGGWLDGQVLFSDHYDKSVFHALVDAGVTVGSFTMPITYPSYIDGKNGSWMVSGFPAAGDRSKLTTPDRIESYLPDDFDTLQARELLNSEDDRPEPVENWVEAEERKRNEILPNILKNNEVDVLFYGSQIADVMGHRCRPKPMILSRGVDRFVPKINNILGTNLRAPRLGSVVWNRDMRRSYIEIDNILGDLRKEYNPNRVLIISDHGFGLASKDHTFVGCSAAYGDIYRPEYVIEVKNVILDALNIDKLPSISSPEVNDDNLSDSEKEDITEQLTALGYSK